MADNSAHDAASADGLIASISAAIAQERQKAGWSLSELARRAQVSKSTLSQLEAGNGNPSVETLWALAAALEIPFSRLIEPQKPDVRVVRFGEGPETRAEAADYTATLLTACAPGAACDLYSVRFEPGQPKRSKPHGRGTVEHLVLSRGRALIGPADAPVELNPGDYICYPGDRAHVFEALEPGTVAIILMEHR